MSKDSVDGDVTPVEGNVENKSEVELLRECLKEQTRVAQTNADALAQLSEVMQRPRTSPNSTTYC